MIALIQGHPTATSDELVTMLFEACKAFGDGRPWEDDATAVVVKRLPKTS